MPARYFQPAHSAPEHYVPQYAPLPLDAIRYGAEQAMHTYERGQEALGGFEDQHQEILQSLTPQNRVAAQEILSRDQELIDRLIDPDSDIPYQDMVPIIRRKARRTMREIMPYVEDSARMREFVQNMESAYDKGNLSTRQRDHAVAQMQQYEGLQFDEDGGFRGFQPPRLVRNVDVHKKISDFMRHLQDGNEAAMIAALDGDDRFVREITTRFRTGDELQMIRQMLAHRLTTADPEVREFLGAELEAENYFRAQAGDEPLELEQLVDRFTFPYVAAESMERQTQRLRNNPAFSRDDLMLGGLSARAIIGGEHSTITTPGDFLHTLHETKEIRDSIGNEIIETLGQMGIQATVNPETGDLTVTNYEDSQGRDQSDLINQYRMQYHHVFDNHQRLNQYHEDILRQIGAPEGWETVMTEHEDEFLDQYAQVVGSDPRTQGQPYPWEQRARDEGKSRLEAFRETPHYQRAMRRSNPHYRAYAEQMAKNAAPGSMEVNLSRLTSDGEKFMRNYLLEANVPLFEGKDMRPLHKVDFDLKDARFAGMTPPINGRSMALYQVPDEDGRNLRSILAEPPDGIRAHLLAAGDYDAFDRGTLDFVGTLSDVPGGRTEVGLPFLDPHGRPYEDAPGISVRTLHRGERERTLGGGELNRYEVIVPSSRGDTPYYVRTMQDVADIYRNASIKLWDQNAKR